MNTRANTPDAIKTYYARLLLRRAVPNFHYAMFGQQPLQQEVENTVPLRAGDTIEWRRWNSLPSVPTPITEGVTPADCDIDLTLVSAQLQQYGCPTRLSDKFIATAIDPVVSAAVELQGEQAARTWDEIARGVLTTGTNVQFAGAAVSRVTITPGDLINSAELHEAVVTLKNADAVRYSSLGGPPAYVGIISPATSHDLQQDDDWKDADKYGASAANIMNGEAGMLHGVRFFETSTAAVDPGAGASGQDIHLSMIFGMGFYGVPRLDGTAVEVIVKPPGSGGPATPMNLYGSVAWKSCFAVARLNENFGVRLEHSVS